MSKRTNWCFFNVFKQLFPNSKIYGADIDIDTKKIFEKEDMKFTSLIK